MAECKHPEAWVSIKNGKRICGLCGEVTPEPEKKEKKNARNRRNDS